MWFKKFREPKKKAITWLKEIEAWLKIKRARGETVFPEKEITMNGENLLRQAIITERTKIRDVPKTFLTNKCIETDVDVRKWVTEFITYQMG